MIEYMETLLKTKYPGVIAAAFLSYYFVGGTVVWDIPKFF